MKKYAFLDRDGTLIFEPPDTFQIDSISKLQILDGVIDGLRELENQGYSLILVSNQNGLGTDSFPTENFLAPQNRMLKIFQDNDIVFEEIFICPHFPEDNCECRKPKLGILGDFLARNEIDKENSFVCGDRMTDRVFAENLGIRFIPMLTNGSFSNVIKNLN